MSSPTSPVFTGVSSYANDLQNVITRAVSIASMPLTQLNNQLNDSNSQSAAVAKLTSTFEALQTAMQTLSGAVGPGGLSATSSDPGAVSVSVAGAIGPDSYTVDVLDPGASSASISSAGLPPVSDPSSASISSSSAYTLTVNGKAFQISNAGNLTALVHGINSSGAGVQASLINTGDSASPSYRLVVRSTTLGADTIQLSDGSAALLDTLNTGKPAQYTVNGLPSPITSSSRTVILAPGVSAELLKKTTPGEPVTVSVSRDDASVESSLSKFVDAYNAAVDAVDQHIGQNAGILSGQSIIYDLRKSLSSINQYTDTGSVKSLAELGISLDNSGKLSLNSSTLASVDGSAVESFLGGADSAGFLHSVSQVLSQIVDPLKGELPEASTLLADQIKRQNSLIAESQRRIEDLQTSLQQQMAAADATLARLENQRSYFSNLFTAMTNYNLNGAGVKAS